MNQQLRLRLCRAPIVDSLGAVNHDYFKVRPGQYWSEEDQILLKAQVDLHGVDNLALIAEAFVGRKSEVEIELRTCILLGVPDLSELTKHHRPRAKSPQGSSLGKEGSGKKSKSRKKH
jgi:hypothetical protein